MKKILSILLVLLMLCSVALTACDTGSSDTSAASSSSSSNGGSNNGGGGNGGGGGGGNKPDTPTAGYSFKTIDNRLRIEYPSTWEDQTEDEAFCCMETASFSILSVYADVGSYWYDFEFNENFDESDLLESFRQYDSMEFKKLERLDNANGVTVNTISFSYQMNQTMIMYLFEVKIDEIYYEIRLMMPEGNDIIAQTVFDSITDVSTTPGSGNGGGNGDGGGPEIPSNPPTGYTFFTINDLRFAYPQTWTVDTYDDGETEISSEDGNNMQISYDQGAAVFQNITAEEYYSIFAPILEAEGITVSNVTAEKRENSLGLEINVIIADLSYQGIPRKQVTYATTLNNNAYAIILALVEENADLEEKIFDSMVNLNPSEDEGNNPPDPNAPAGYKTFTNYNLRFAYPDAWTTSAVANTRGATFEGGLYRLDLTSGPLTTMFSSLTTNSFRENMVPGLEEQLKGTIADEYVEQIRNENGLTVTLVSFSITDADMSGWMIWYCVDIDQSTHCLMLTTVVENEELIMAIFNSITAVDGPNVSNGSESDPGTSTKPEGNDPGTSTKPEGNDPGTSTKPEGTDPGTSTKPEGNDPGTSTNPSNKEQEIYEKAINCYEKGKYDKAYDLFSQIPDYSDVDKYLDKLEEMLGLNGSPNKPETGDPSISEKEAEKIYQTATTFFEQGDYKTAYELFAQIPDYSDAKTYIQKLEQILKI